MIPFRAIAITPWNGFEFVQDTPAQWLLAVLLRLPDCDSFSHCDFLIITMNVPAIMKGMLKKNPLHSISKKAGQLESDSPIVPQYW